MEKVKLVNIDRRDNDDEPEVEITDTGPSGEDKPVIVIISDD